MTSRNLHVVVDGIIFQLQARGGISRLYSEILPRMCDIDLSLEISLLTTGSLKQALPQHARIEHCCLPPLRRYLRPGRLWAPLMPSIEGLVRRIYLEGSDRRKIWHSTYYTVPGLWDGNQVVTVYDMIHERSQSFNARGRFLARKHSCITNADAIICISEVTRRDVQLFYGLPSDRLHVVPLACSSVFRQLPSEQIEQELAQLDPFLLYIGRHSCEIDHYKNFDRLLQAYASWSHNEDVQLIVVGPSWSPEEESRLTELGIQDRVSLFANVDDERLCQLYNQAVAFVYPSLYEGFGLPLLEAMSCGCPVVASDIPSTREIAENVPIYFEPADVEGLRDALYRGLEVASNDGRRLKGLEISGSYSWQNTARKTLEVYSALCNA